MSDFKRILKIYFDFHQGRSKSNLAPPTPRRDQVDLLRTIFWYHGLRIRTGCESSYKLEQLFDPDSFKAKEGVPFNRSKWQKYARGLNTPQAEKISEVESLVPGTSGEINHVLWKTLLPTKTTQSDIDQWLLQIEPSLRTILYESEPAALGTSYRRKAVGRRLINSVAQRASIDALACLTILLREAVLHDQHELAFDIAHRIYDVLLMVGIELQERHVAVELFDLFRDRIFSLVNWNSYLFYMDGAQTMRASFILNSSVFKISGNKDKRLSWSERVFYMRKILSGKYGDDLGFALRLSYGPAVNAITLDPKEEIEFKQREGLKAWGWNCIDSQKIGMRVPDEVLRGPG